MWLETVKGYVSVKFTSSELVIRPNMKLIHFLYTSFAEYIHSLCKNL